MCRWIAYCGEPILVEELVTLPEKSLIVQSHSSLEGKSAVNGDGFGIGWYGERPEPGVFRDVRPAWSDENLISLASQIRSGLFFAHVRASTGTATMRANCHPFAHGKLLFMHNGGIGNWDAARRPLEAALPDDLYKRRCGTTDSEVIFLLLVAHGLAENPKGAFTRTVGLIEETIRRAGITEPFRLTAAASDGRAIHAVRYSTLIAPETLYVRSLHRCRGLLLASEPFDRGRQDWEAIPPQSFVTLERERLHIEPFVPSRSR